MRKNNSIVRGGPGQDVGVTRTSKANVLNANDVEVRLTQKQCPHDVAIEVLIGKQPQHLWSSRPSLGEQASADFA